MSSLTVRHMSFACSEVVPLPHFAVLICAAQHLVAP